MVNISENILYDKINTYHISDQQPLKHKISLIFIDFSYVYNILVMLTPFW